MTDRSEFIGREFVHFKGGRYRLVGIAKDSETLQPVAVYQALYGDGGLWTRPAEMFFGTVVRDGETIPRFAPVPETRSTGAEQPGPAPHRTSPG